MKQFIIVPFVFAQLTVFGQVNPFKLNLQTNSSLIQFNKCSGSKYYYSYYINLNDSIKCIDSFTKSIKPFIDSVKRIGYVDKPPINLVKTTSWDINIISHQFLRIDTIYNKLDSIFITNLKVSVINLKYKINHSWTYKLYSNMNEDTLNEKIKHIHSNNLAYYTKSKIYFCYIDVTIFAWLIGKREKFQSGDHFEFEYFK